MNKIQIHQDKTRIETTQNSLVEYLYNIDKRETNNADIDFIGSIKVVHAYGDAVEYLTNKYNNFDITVSHGMYIRFKDSILADALVSMFSSDGVGITYEDAQNTLVIDENQVNQIPKTITSFDELQYFYVTKLVGNSFHSCANLQSINLKRIQEVGSYCFVNNSSLTNIGDTSSIRKIYGDAFNGCDLTGDLSFPSLETATSAIFKNNTHLTSVTFSNNFNIFYQNIYDL